MGCDFFEYLYSLSIHVVYAGLLFSCDFLFSGFGVSNADLNNDLNNVPFSSVFLNGTVQQWSSLGVGCNLWVVFNGGSYFFSRHKDCFFLSETSQSVSVFLPAKFSDLLPWSWSLLSVEWLRNLQCCHLSGSWHWNLAPHSSLAFSFTIFLYYFSVFYFTDFHGGLYYFSLLCLHWVSFSHLFLIS